MEQQARAELSDLIHWAHNRGWAPGTGGNFGLVLEQNPFRLLITPSGMDKGSIREGDLIVVNANGEIVKGDQQPSAETLLHIALAQSVGARVVAHTHSIWNTLASLSNGNSYRLSGYEMLKGLSGVKTHEHIEEVPILQNSQDMSALAGELSSVLEAKETHAVLIRGHGMTTWGTNIAETKRHLEVFEFLFELEGRSKRRLD